MSVLHSSISETEEIHPIQKTIETDEKDVVKVAKRFIVKCPDMLRSSVRWCHRVNGRDQVQVVNWPRITKTLDTLRPAGTPEITFTPRRMREMQHHYEKFTIYLPRPVLSHLFEIHATTRPTQ